MRPGWSPETRRCRKGLLSGACLVVTRDLVVAEVAVSGWENVNEVMSG